MQLRRFVTIDAQIADKRSVRYVRKYYDMLCEFVNITKRKILLTAAQIDQIRNVEMLVIDKGRMDTRTGTVIDAEIIQMRIAAKQIALLVVDHQLLDEFVVFGDVQMMSDRRLASPARIGIFSMFVK